MSQPASLAYVPEPRTELRTYEPEHPGVTPVEDKVFISKVVTVEGWFPRSTQCLGIPVKQDDGTFADEPTHLIAWYGKVKEFHGKYVSERDLKPIIDRA